MAPPVLMGGLVAWEDAFTPAELDGIQRYAETLAHERAELADRHRNHDSIRVTKVAWIGRNAQTESVYARMEEIVLSLNSRYFKYDLFGLASFQYAIYDGSEGGHFDWHKDYGRDASDPSLPPRKLTVSIQLSDPSSYEGCELQVRGGNQIDTAPKKRGTVIAFPSYVLHRVTPITAGTRKALVIWATGPEFR